MAITVNQVSNTQTFGAWLQQTNRLANLMTTNVVTADATNAGSLTTGNSYVNGHFGANFVYVANTLIGGTLANNQPLRIRTRSEFVASNGTQLVAIDSGGNVGIWTNSTADERLNVNGFIRTNEGIRSNTEFELRFNSTNTFSFRTQAQTVATFSVNAITINSMHLVLNQGNVNFNINTTFFTNGSLSIGSNTTDTFVFVASNGHVGIRTTNAQVSFVVGSTDALRVPVGNVGQRPSVNTGGFIRFNSESGEFEGYDGSAWGKIGGSGGAVGNTTTNNAIFYLNDQIVTGDYTIPGTRNAGTFGPITIANGVTVTVSNGATWTVV